MIIRKDNTKKESVIVGVWFPKHQTQKFDNGKRSINFRIALSDIKNIRDFQNKIERFLKAYVSEQ
jgi:hypothetical protein